MYLSYILCSYSLGVGVFVIPSVMNLCGIALGIILIFLIGFIAASAQVMLVRIAKQYGTIPFLIQRYKFLKMASHGAFFLFNFISANSAATI